jgi:hypothetical protein
MAETDDDEIVRGHNHRGLAASARHVNMSLAGPILASTIDPKKGTVNRTLVGHPSPCWGADKPAVEFPAAFTGACVGLGEHTDQPFDADQCPPFAFDHSLQRRLGMAAGRNRNQGT